MSQCTSHETKNFLKDKENKCLPEAAVEIETEMGLKGQLQILVTTVDLRVFTFAKTPQTSKFNWTHFII
jgi:hypothetical protein